MITEVFSIKFYILCGATALTFFWFSIGLALMKSYGIFYLKNDHLVSYLVSASSFCGIGGRLFWPAVADKIGFKKTVTAILTVNMGLTVAINWAAYSSTTYGVFLGIFYFNNSG